MEMKTINIAGVNAYCSEDCRKFVCQVNRKAAGFEVHPRHNDMVDTILRRAGDNLNQVIAI